MAGQSRGVDGMAVEHRPNLRPARQDVRMEAPLRGGTPGAVIPAAASQIQGHQILRLHQLVGQGTGGDQQTPGDPHRQIARGALVEAGSIHAPGHRYQLLTQLGFGAGGQDRGDGGQGIQRRRGKPEGSGKAAQASISRA